MRNIINRQVRLKSRPVGIPEADHFEIVETQVPELKDGQILIQNIYLSVDPAMRGWVNAAANYLDPVPVGGVMRSFAVGRVLESRHKDYRAGETVSGIFGWQDYAAVDETVIERKVPVGDLPISTALGILGINGLTAYFGLFEIGKPIAGETVVISAAAGAVGSCVGQMAKTAGCRTVGITDGPAKARLCLDLFRYDAAIDYEQSDLVAALDDVCPEGVDVYFDTSSGPISDSVMTRLRIGARVVICGTIAIPNWDPIPFGPRVERHLLLKRASMRGFLYSDFKAYYQKALEDISRWILEGLISYKEDILDGIEQAPGSIVGLYRGENMGKRLIRIAEE